MPVYVSDEKQMGTKRWSHMTADDDKELLRMAERLKLKLPKKQRQKLHFDLNPFKRILALRYGAKERNEE